MKELAAVLLSIAFLAIGCSDPLFELQHLPPKATVVQIPDIRLSLRDLEEVEEQPPLHDLSEKIAAVFDSAE